MTIKLSIRLVLSDCGLRGRFNCGGSVTTYGGAMDFGRPKLSHQFDATRTKALGEKQSTLGLELSGGRCLFVEEGALSFPGRWCYKRRFEECGWQWLRRQVSCGNSIEHMRARLETAVQLLWPGSSC